MALPNRLSVHELEAHGFKVLSRGKAKHGRYSSWRYQCASCGYWEKQLTNGLCPQCRRAHLKG